MTGASAVPWDAVLLDVGRLPVAPARLAPVGVLPARSYAMPVRSLLLRRARHTVLVDAGPGPLVRHWPGGHDRLGEALSGAGVDPGDVELVVLTHLDFDHVGGALAATGAGGLEPAFPRARVVAVGDGIRAARGASPTSQLDLAPVAVAALDADGRLDELADGDEPVPGLRVRTLPGHRAGHAGFEIDTRDGRLVHLGDLFHHALHVANPAWHDAFDDDPELARRTRAALTEEVAARGVLCVGGHLPGTRPGRVVRAGDGHAWSVERVE